MTRREFADREIEGLVARLVMSGIASIDEIIPHMHSDMCLDFRQNYLELDKKRKAKE